MEGLLVVSGGVGHEERPTVKGIEASGGTATRLLPLRAERQESVSG
jgi:hypothetical protein